jgi:hypothetical protein
VLGLGKTVVDGGRSLCFSPAHPRRLYQFSSTEATLRTAQSEFVALDLSDPNLEELRSSGTDAALETLGLDVAEQHETLHAVGSVYDQEAHAIYDGISRPGPRLVTMAGVLKGRVAPLDETIGFMLQVGTAAFSGPVEIEFAVDLRRSPQEHHRFAFLQIRPVVADPIAPDVQLHEHDPEYAICVSHSALGNGRIEDVRDLIYVPESSFDRARTVEIADEIGHLNARLRKAGRPYLLIGPGRWGSADRWLGIPVAWSQISGAACIVETDMHDIQVTPSQGSHFFQNMTSLGIAYFSVNFGSVKGSLDLEWLDAHPAEEETEFIRLIHFDDPLDIAVDGKQGLGVVMKPGFRISSDPDDDIELRPE